MDYEEIAKRVREDKARQKQIDKIRLKQELRKAQDTGDEKKVKELTKKLREMQ